MWGEFIMINLYVAQSSASSRKTKEWLKTNQIPYKERNINSNPLGEKEIRRILSLTENGSEDIISTRSHIFSKLHLNMDKITVDQLIKLMVKYPDLLKRPIVFDDKRLVVGFNEEEIRCFLPRSVRKATLRELETKIS